MRSSLPRILFLVLAAVAVAASPAAAADGEPTSGGGASAPTEERLQRLDPACRASVAALLDSARADSLPVEPLLLRALEGSTKGAAPPRIVQAVSTLLSRLRAARRLLGPARAEEELLAGAGCLAAGVDTTALRRIGTTQRKEPLVVPLVVLTDLVARGAPIETAAKVTLDMVSAGLPDRQFLELRSAIQEDVAAGRRPGDAVLSRFRALPLPDRPPGEVPRTAPVRPQGR